MPVVRNVGSRPEGVGSQLSPLTGCTAFGKVLRFSMPLFLHL